MAISHRLLNRLIRLEQLQHQQQLSDIKQGLADLEKQNMLIEALDQLITTPLFSSHRSPGTAHPLLRGLQLNNGSVFRAQLLTNLQQCLDVRSQQMTAIKAMADIARIRQQRLKRLRSLPAS
ncbi:hypothetical protein [Endozoicomonas sp.]|uniref:hypothetical protein n=1 Tax=Endozoicomonas sp. TaxID=1892382 RepID=UPI003839E9F4